MSHSTIPTIAAARPLDGKRVVLTRPRSQSGDFEARVLALGGEPIVAPAIAIVPPESWTDADRALRRIATYDWIVFTSANAVRMFVARANAIGTSRDSLVARRLAAVGSATAAAIAPPLRPPDVVSRVHRADALADELPDMDGKRVLFPCGDLAAATLAARLRQRGALVDDVVVYRTVEGEGVAAIAAGVRDGTIDALVFASASAVRAVASALMGEPAIGEPRAPAAHAPGRPVVACIGPLTADAARQAGFEPTVVAESATQNELVNSLALWFAEHRDDVTGMR